MFTRRRAHSKGTTTPSRPTEEAAARKETEGKPKQSLGDEEIGRPCGQETSEATEEAIVQACCEATFASKATAWET